MRPFSLLIKAASADCNLRCEYCFYLDRAGLYPDSKVHRMDEKTLEKMISSYMATSQPQYAFGWQGGEPTLMGVDFFRKAVEFQEKYGRRGAMVANGLQTNAILIDDEYAELFAKYKFLVGVSLDGPAEIHDRFRKNLAGNGSHAGVVKAIDTLGKHNVEYNILSLVSASNVKNARTVYEYYRENNFNYLQFIPCVEFDDDNKILPFAINGEDWGDFLCEIFDMWYPKDTRTVSIRLFDSILVLLVEKQRNICHIGRNCCQYFVVEHNGDVYPCDFFVRKELLLGNIHEDDWDSLQKSEKYREFGAKKADWQNKCAQCEFLYICSGDCLKHRIYGTVENPRNLSWLCEGWKKFYRHSLPKFKKLAEQIIEERRQAMMMQQMQKNPAMRFTPGRNDPCPCGSGKKFKKCCGK